MLNIIIPIPIYHHGGGSIGPNGMLSFLIASNIFLLIWYVWLVLKHRSIIRPFTAGFDLDEDFWAMGFAITFSILNGMAALVALTVYIETLL